MLRILGILVGLGVVGLIGFITLILVWGVPAAEERATLTGAEDIAQGKYMVEMGDCVSCHTAEGKAPELAGGYPMATPFGTIYTPNITPHKETGIGDMTSAEFYQIMVAGADSVFAPLYPAMPYTSFHILERDDTDKIHAYLMSLKPVDRPKTPNEMGFPFNIRPLMFGWDFLFASREKFEPDPNRDEVYNRGKWIVEGLAHCGECHSPRNPLGAMEEGDKFLAGGFVGELEAPNIQAAALKERGWNREDLVIFLETGTSPQGSAFGEMFLAVKNSFQNMTHDDMVAVATFLLDGTADMPTKGELEVAALGDRAHPNKAGQALYLSHCALCHGKDGEGIPGAIPPLKRNSTLGQQDAHNLVTVLTYGLAPAEVNDNTPAYGQMPSFGNRMTWDEKADLVNYVRASFAPNPDDLREMSADDVRNIVE